jgi:hypothetical protein
VKQPFRGAGIWVQPGTHTGTEILPGISLLTGNDLKPFQTQFCDPELADPYVTQMKDSVIVSGTAQYYLAFSSLADLFSGGPFEIIWNDYYYSDGTLMEGQRLYANSWDMKPSLWSRSPASVPRLWNPSADTDLPMTVWYGGHMRPRSAGSVSSWPDDNYSRDVFAFTEREPGEWFSEADSIFASHGDWPRAPGNYLGHRYGHQIVGRENLPPLVFYEEVTQVFPWGGPAATEIFMDEMADPLHASGTPTKLISPFKPLTGQPYPSTIREDGSVLVEGPLYFQFVFDHEQWEAIGFSAGSYYSRYPAAFASRRVSDGLLGMPYQIDLTDDGSDLHDAGAVLGGILHLIGGPGRPSVIVDNNGRAIPDAQGNVRILLHAYRQDVQNFREVIEATLKIQRGPNGALRFDLALPEQSSGAEQVRPFSKKWF